MPGTRYKRELVPGKWGGGNGGISFRKRTNFESSVQLVLS
jgi:hypothetical protein